MAARPRRRSTFRAPTSDIFTRYSRIRRASSRAIAFIEHECRVPAGRDVGKPYRLRAHHKRDLRRLLDSGALVAILSAPRGYAKTGIAAPLLVWALYDREGAQVLASSTGMRTAGLAYGRAVRIIELNPRLAEQAMVYRNAAEPWVELPARGATMRPLPAEERHIVGFAPTLILVDEVGYVLRSTYEAMQTSLGKSPDTLLLGFGTPGLSAADAEGTILMYQLREQATGASPPPGLVYVEHAARPGDDPSDRRTWKRANPGLGDLVDAKAVAIDYATMPPARFGQMRLGLWTQRESALVTYEAWDALTIEPGPVADGTAVALGFDGSVSRDATALWAYELVSGRLVELGYWQRPPGVRSWEVKRSDVLEVIVGAFERLEVVAMYADPWLWRTELQGLVERFGEDRVVVWNTAAPARMGPATDAFVMAVAKRELLTDGSATLRAHVTSAVAKMTAAGPVIVKDARHPALIDACVAAILAYEAGRSTPERIVPAIY